jgi:hypothetical protein
MHYVYDWRTNDYVRKSDRTIRSWEVYAQAVEWCLSANIRASELRRYEVRTYSRSLPLPQPV